MAMMIIDLMGGAPDLSFPDPEPEHRTPPRCSDLESELQYPELQVVPVEPTLEIDRVAEIVIINSILGA